MPRLSLYQELLLALRSAPNRNLGELADSVGLPRTTFGRRLPSRLREPIERLLADGLVEEQDGRYRLSELGRRHLADQAFDAPPR